MSDRLYLIAEEIDTERLLVRKGIDIHQTAAQREFSRLRHEIHFPEPFLEEHVADHSVGQRFTLAQRKDRIPDLFGTQHSFLHRFGISNDEGRGNELFFIELRGDLVTAVEIPGQAGNDGSRFGNLGPAGNSREGSGTLQKGGVLFVFRFFRGGRKIEQIVLQEEIVEVGGQVIGLLLGVGNHDVKRTGWGALHRIGYVNGLGRNDHIWGTVAWISP